MSTDFCLKISLLKLLRIRVVLIRMIEARVPHSPTSCRPEHENEMK